MPVLWISSCGWLSFLVPASLGVWHGVSAATWRSDGASLALLGGPPSWQSAMSGLFGQLVQLLPVGSTLGRAASISGLALGLAGALLFRLTLGLLERNASAPRLNGALALCAATTSCLSLPWLSEGSLVGGQAVAGALGLATLWCASVGAAGAPWSPARLVLVGALLSATALESLWAALAVVVALLVWLWQGGRLPRLRQAALFAAASVMVLGAGLAPALLSPVLAPLQDLTAQRTASLQAGWGFERLALDGLSPTGALGPWLDDLGLLVPVVALVGAGWGLLQRPLRNLFAPVGVIVLVDLIVSSAQPSELVAHGRIGLHLLALAVVACAAALGLQTLSVLARRAGLLGARPAVVLLGVLAAAVTWAGAEDSVRMMARRNLDAAETWTDEVLGSLPYRSLVVVDSLPVVQRLAAGISGGGRPDVVIVPLPLLGRGSLAAELLEIEPALALLIRELSTSGRPSEQALSALADVRPLFVEADGTWDRRLVAHLLPGPFLARFAPHPLGRSDRRLALSGERAAFERVASVALGPSSRDEGTLSVLVTSVGRQRDLLELLGDRAEARELDESLQQFGFRPHEPKPAGALASR